MPKAKRTSSNKVRAVIIGVGGFGATFLRALAECPNIDLAGLSDKDGALAAKTADETGVKAYSDNRSLLAEAQPQAAFLCIPPMAGPELVNACADRGIHVWKEMPLARTLAEAANLVRRMDKAGLKFAVGTQRRFDLGYQRARELCRQLGQVFLARSHYLFNWGPNLGWRGDKSSAGGGALLQLGYHPIDLLVGMLGLPEEVYGSIAGGKRPVAQPDARGKLQPPYDTEDTASGLLRYADGCVATIVASRCSGPVSEELALHGRHGSVVASAESCLLRDPDGRILDQAQEQVSPVEVHARQVGDFAQAVLEGRKWYDCSAWENLLTMAVIEAMYLSERTNQPENPLRLLRTLDLTVGQCLSCRRPAEDLPAVGQPADQES